MPRTSKIGVAIPTYNREGSLGILLNSIPKEIPVLVSDNGNFTSQKFKDDFKHCEFIGSDDVLTYVPNWNRAVNNLHTEWICVASDDDVFYENAFLRFQHYLDLYADSEIIIFGHKNIDENGKEINQWCPSELKVFESPLGYNEFKFGVDARVIGVFFKRELFVRIGGFDENCKITAADSLFIQLALLNAKSIIVPEITVGYRVWSKSLTSQTIATKQWMDDVIYWQQRIKKELQKNQVDKNKVQKYTDEVIALNLREGIATMYRQKKSIADSLRFLKQFEYPMHSKLRTQLSVVKCLLKTALKI
jgi:glycosyltransferase involved in cell wall biosynthesis